MFRFSFPWAVLASIHPVSLRKKVIVPVARNSILILYAHPSQGRSEVNQEMVHDVEGTAGVTLIDLYAEYPTFEIDIDREQGRLRSHDIIVFQFPLYWYSTPSILKEWQDLVLEYGFAYGSDGTALHGKVFLTAITTGGAEDAYSHEGYNHFPLRHLLSPLEQTANLCGMTYLPPFVLYGSRTAREHNHVAAHADRWVHVLDLLKADRLNLAKAAMAPTLNDALETEGL